MMINMCKEDLAQKSSLVASLQASLIICSWALCTQPVSVERFVLHHNEIHFIYLMIYSYLKLKLLEKCFSLGTQLTTWFWWARGFLPLQVEMFLSMTLRFLGNLMGGYSKIKKPVFTPADISGPAKSCPKERAWDVPRATLIYSPLYYMYSLCWVPGRIQQYMETWLSPTYWE